MIGIIGAMKIEVEELKNRMSDVRIEKISQIDFYCGRLCGKDVVVAVSGVGKVNAAICAQTMILRFQPSCVINTGVAGGIAGNVHIGDIVIGTAVVQHDMDTSPLGDPVGFISGIGKIQLPCAPWLTEALSEAAEHVKGTTFHHGIIATGDQFLNRKEDLNRIVERFEAMACEMEGGSIGQVCYINGVDFAIVRAISDGGDDNSHMDYGEFVQIAAAKSISLLSSFLEME